MRHNVALYSRSHGPRGNAILDAPRPRRYVAACQIVVGASDAERRNEWVPTQSVGTRFGPGADRH